jgi:uncharacterized protein YjbI with pentapeptide repeats
VLLEDHVLWQDVVLEGEDLARAAARGVEIRRSRLIEVDLSGAQLKGLALVDCDVRQSNLANLMAIDGVMRRCTFTGCRMTGFAWPQGTLENVRFSDCLIDLAAFGFARLRRVVFEDCILRDADFRETRIELTKVHRCDLSTASFASARFDRKSELRGCTLEDLRGVEGLRGAAMEWSDVVGLAGTFAAALGIRVLDDDQS